MLRADRLCVYTLMFGFAFLIPSIDYIKFTDELCVLILGTIALLDCVVNNSWKRYTLLWIVLGTVSFYALYSVAFLHFNTPRYILIDFIIEAKPFIPVAVFLAIRPVLKQSDKKILCIIALFNATVMTICLAGGRPLVIGLVTHYTYAGLIIYISMLMYIFCNIDSNGDIPRKKLLIALFFLTAGLACTRSKYYVIYILTLYFLLLYRPGICRNINFKHVVGFSVLAAIVIAAGWSKFSYYFLTGNSESFDPSVVETFARPVLYVTASLILFDYFPFGSGLASFATHASALNYSQLYYEYGINTVYGLSPQMGEFICDAYYPSLAQFGIAGIILFVIFWVYVFSFLKTLIRSNATLYRNAYVIGSLAICFILIESAGGNTFSQSVGFIVMCLLGLTCAQGKELRLERSSLRNSSNELKPQKI